MNRNEDIILQCSGILSSRQASIAVKSQALLKMMDEWERVAPDDDYYRALPSETRTILDNYWEIHKSVPSLLLSVTAKKLMCLIK